MIEREPDVYGQWADGMDPGPSNPLGSRALYLYEGERDTYLRIHGTPQPRTIGTRASSGCVRMVMAHINDLYGEVDVGATAHLYPGIGRTPSCRAMLRRVWPRIGRKSARQRLTSALQLRSGTGHRQMPGEEMR